MASTVTPVGDNGLPSGSVQPLNFEADFAARIAGPFLDPPGRMLREPFLRLDLSVPGAMERQLERRTVVGRDAELNLFADGR